MTIGQRIKERREALGITQEELAKKIGYTSKSTINKIELGINDLRQSKIAQIANALGVTPGYIMGWADESGNPCPRKSAIKVPVYGSIPAGIPVEAIEEEPNDYEEIVANPADSFIALTVKGSSMYPYIMDGDTVIIRRQDDCESGEVCAVFANGDYEATLKKVVKVDGHVVLQPFNPEYSPIFTDKARIVGKVIEIRRKL